MAYRYLSCSGFVPEESTANPALSLKKSESAGQPATESDPAATREPDAVPAEQYTQTQPEPELPTQPVPEKVEPLPGIPETQVASEPVTSLDTAQASEPIAPAVPEPVQETMEPSPDAETAPASQLAREGNPTEAQPSTATTAYPETTDVPTTYEPTHKASPYKTADIGTVGSPVQTATPVWERLEAPSASLESAAISTQPETTAAEPAKALEPPIAPSSVLAHDAETAPAAVAPATTTDQYQTPEDSASLEEEPEEGYSSSDPDVNPVVHHGTYAAEAAQRTAQYAAQPEEPVTDSKRNSRVPASLQIPEKTQNTSTEPQTAADATTPGESKSNAVEVGPDGAVDQIGTVVGSEERHPATTVYAQENEFPAEPAEQVPQVEANPSKTSKSIKRLSFRRGGGKDEKPHSRSSGGSGLLHRINTVLLTDIASAAGNHEDKPISSSKSEKPGKSEEPKSGLLRSLSARSSSHPQRNSGQYQSNAVGDGVILSDDEEESTRAPPSGWSTRIDKHTRQAGGGGLPSLGKSNRHSLLSAHKFRLHNGDSDSDEPSKVYAHHNDGGGTTWPANDSIFGSEQPFLQQPSDTPISPPHKRKSSKRYSRASAHPSLPPAEPPLDSASSPQSNGPQTPSTPGHELPGKSAPHHPTTVTRTTSTRTHKSLEGKDHVYVPGDASDWVQAGKTNSLARAGSGSVRSTAASRKKALNGISLPSEKTGPTSWIARPDHWTARDHVAVAGVVPRDQGEPASEQAAAEWKHNKKLYRRSVREKQAAAAAAAAAAEATQPEGQPGAEAQGEPKPEEADTAAEPAAPEPEEDPEPKLKQQPLDLAVLYPALPSEPKVAPAVTPEALAAAASAPPGPVLPPGSDPASGAERKPSVKSVRTVRTKGSKKSRRTVDTLATSASRPTGTNTGHTYEALLYPPGAGTAPTDAGSVLGLDPHPAALPAPTGVPYQVTAPGSSLVPGAYPPSVPKAPSHSGEWARAYAARSPHPAYKGKDNGRKWSTRIVGQPPVGSALGSRPGASDEEDVPDYRRAQDAYDEANFAYQTARSKKASDLAPVTTHLLNTGR